MSSGVEPLGPGYRVSPSGKIGYLDGWRGIAIVLVLLDHFLPLPGLDSGRLGADVFFALSGLLMSRILFVQRIPLPLFYKRRISRVLPVFMLYVLTVYAIAFYRDQSFDLVEFLSALAFLRTYIPASPDIWHTALPIGHLWSLNVEEHCYLLMGVLAAFLSIRGREWAVLMALGISAIIVHAIYLKNPSLGIVLSEIRTETAASHLLLSAGYFLVRDRFSRYVRPWMPVAAFAGAILCNSVALPWWASFLVSPFLLAFAVNHLAETPRLVRTGLEFTPLRMFGIWPYSIYLWQQPFYTYKSSLPVGIAFLLAITLGVLSFYFFENPVRSWLNRTWHWGKLPAGRTGRSAQRRFHCRIGA